MAQIAPQFGHVNGFSIPGDPNWNPQPVVLPEHFLQEAPPPLDLDDFPDWTETLALLPQGRRNRVKKCRRAALHIKKHTDKGTTESLNPIACGDRVACPHCSIRYAHERGWGASNKLATVSLTAQNLGLLNAAPVHVLEFRAVIPEWNAAVKVKGCDTSEIRARLCPATSGCIACQGAAQTHAGAALVEQDLARWTINTWTALRADTGGERHTSVRQDAPGAPIQLVITLHIPAVSARVFPGAKIAGARAQRRSFIALQDAEIDKLRQDWIAFVSANYGAPAATMQHTAPLHWQDIWDSFRHTHAAPWMVWTAMLAQNPDAVITPDAGPTFARAAGLGTMTDKGKARRVQRTSWFGIFGGRHQIEVMHALDIHPEVREPHATIEVVDSVRIIHRGDTHTRAQSTRTAEFLLFPNEMVRLSDSVDTSGRPSVSAERVEWVYSSPTRSEIANEIWKQQLQLARHDAGQVQIADNASLQSAPGTRQTWGQTKRAEKAARLAAIR